MGGKRSSDLLVDVCFFCLRGHFFTSLSLFFPYLFKGTKGICIFFNDRAIQTGESIGLAIKEKDLFFYGFDGH